VRWNAKLCKSLEIVKGVGPAKDQNLKVFRGTSRDAGMKEWEPIVKEGLDCGIHIKACDLLDELTRIVEGFPEHILRNQWAVPPFPCERMYRVREDSLADTILNRLIVNSQVHLFFVVETGSVSDVFSWDSCSSHRTCWRTRCYR
jgi:hypothetical protein